jgi:hypothetical protein
MHHLHNYAEEIPAKQTFEHWYERRRRNLISGKTFSIRPCPKNFNRDHDPACKSDPEQGHPVADPHRSPNCTIPCLHSPSQIHPTDKETMPVFGKTLPVRRKSGHFKRFFGIARNWKTAEPPEGVQLPELCSILFSFSDVKTTLRKRKPCRFLENHAGWAPEQGNPGPYRAYSGCTPG